MAYADWALGRFLDQASKKPWYADTLFVVVADHGPRIRGRATIPVRSYRVPLVFLAPLHLTSGVRENLGSLMDIPKTLLSLLGITSDQNFWGNDLFNKSDGTALVEYNYHVGSITSRGMTVNRLDGSATAWRKNADGIWIRRETNESELSTLRSIFSRAHADFYDK
jgi:phosphoglycerol transferase MdoB-like AlkP superfamily enzyme